MNAVIFLGILSLVLLVVVIHLAAERSIERGVSKILADDVAEAIEQRDRAVSFNEALLEQIFALNAKLRQNDRRLVVIESESVRAVAKTRWFR